MARQWTNEQKSAIYSKWRDEEKTKSSNILVQAAAGSGKTAVLVERIINKLCADKNSPDYCDIESLLVVTFTNAAANEMQQRIADALNKKYQDALEINDILRAQELKNQIADIHCADITTIDAFCLKVVRNYFYLLEIDPGFTIIDKPQGDMLKEEALDELFEKYYDNDEFITLLSMYSNGTDEQGLGDVILKIYEFTRSIPNPHLWMDEKAQMFLECDENSPWFKKMENIANTEAIKAQDILICAIRYMVNFVYGNTHISKEELIKIFSLNPFSEENELYLTFGNYYLSVYYDYMMYSSLIGQNYETIYKIVNEYSFLNLTKAPDFKNKDLYVTQKEVRAPIKEYRDEAKSIFTKKIKPLFQTGIEENIEILRDEIYPVILMLIKFIKLFEEIYNEKKASKNAVEFSDVEHYCLKLFTDFPEVRNELKEKYTEILMDEYQDSNLLQEEIFQKISRGDNLFMVGDMKQSIYRFRSSEPAIFKRKSNTFLTCEDAQNRKIVLSKNFRSRREVLESINDVFGAVMSEEAGEIEYNEEQQLNFGDESYDEESSQIPGAYKSECYILLNSKSDEECIQKLSDVECEARFIAKKIRELKDSGFKVRDKVKVKKYDKNGDLYEAEENILRPLENRDIVILMSSHKRVSKIYSQEFMNFGIDSYAQSGGYFDKIEIRLALSLLKLISNPYNDVPLISIMRSFVFGFSDDELCIVRRQKGNYFYEAVKNTAELDCNDEEILKVINKCKNLINTISKWQGYTKYMSSDRLLWTLYEETGLYSFCEAVYGNDAGNNLRLLFVRAREYEDSGYKGIFNFIRYINKLKKKEEDLSGAVVFGENSDAVRIMTIHKSKGLEFPVVFLVRNSSEFNKKDVNGHLLLDKELGFGPDYINYENSFISSTVAKNALIEKMKKEIISEEMRKLYVALTRAKEKLIVTCVCNGEKDKAKNYDKWAGAFDFNDGVIPSYISSDAKCFTDWLAPVALKSNKWHFETVPYSNIVNGIDYIVLDDVNEDIDEEKKLKMNIYEGNYKYQSSLGLDVKISVSELKNNINSDYGIIEKPAFMNEVSGLTGAMRGTAIHYVMQKYIPSEHFDYNEVSRFINKLCINNELTKEEAQAVDPQMIVDFYKSQLGQRILKSPKVMREIPFEIEIPASEIYDTQSSDNIMLQGIIDCLFFEDDEIVIVDYKSDYYTDIMEIQQKYMHQLSYYSKAVEKICKKRVKNEYIYLFFTKNVIEY